ncbi:hypothetical protein JB92DRAFT_2830560 [Gautieria morchelliformis]|nr:hypothetical protein JB92DRAFT_2830560 [Gautieria morchelliformis]
MCEAPLMRSQHVGYRIILTVHVLLVSEPFAMHRTVHAALSHMHYPHLHGHQNAWNLSSFLLSPFVEWYMMLSKDWGIVLFAFTRAKPGLNNRGKIARDFDCYLHDLRPHCSHTLSWKTNMFCCALGLFGLDYKTAHDSGRQDQQTTEENATNYAPYMAKPTSLLHHAQGPDFRGALAPYWDNYNMFGAPRRIDGNLKMSGK